LYFVKFIIRLDWPFFLAGGWVELNDKGELIGIEILDASSFMRDSILETAQAKVLNMPLPPNEPVHPDG